MKRPKGLLALRQGLMTRAMKRASASRRVVQVGGLSIVVDAGVCNPSPALGMSFLPLFEAALTEMGPGERVLDLGTGSGVWALLAARAGAEVTATDLPHVPFAPLRESASRSALPPPRLLHGDLFAPVAGERFRRVLFNPPFHIGEPRDEGERAYLGGAGGDHVVSRFLRALPDHLEPGGRGYLLLPRVERGAFEGALAGFDVEARATQWMPLLGRAELLGLTPR